MADFEQANVSRAHNILWGMAKRCEKKLAQNVSVTYGLQKNGSSIEKDF